jgi:hypothetical protein
MFGAFIIATILLIIILAIVYLSPLIPSKEKHLTRNRFNKLPVGTLKWRDNKFVDSVGTVWVRRPYIMSLTHNANKNYVFESYDTSKTSSSEATADKTQFDNGKQIFTHGSFNYHTPFQHPILHVFSDVLPSFLYS